WTALDACDAGNGCMHVIPGSHRAGPKPHYHDRDCQLPDDTVDLGNVVAVPLQPGGVMFFSGLVHHGTPPNLGQRRRRALQFHYMGKSGQHAEDPEVLRSMFFDRKGFAGCQGWSDGHGCVSLKQRPIHLRADF
ncbi:MAG: phytanoyl-CoA dioxygenase family protein, partial [Planctomycetota bacterium]